MNPPNRLPKEIEPCLKHLVEMGVPREEIMLGLQPPYKRQYTE